MLNIERVARQDRWLRVLAGLNVHPFVQLLISFYEAYIEAEQRIVRQRNVGLVE